MAFPQDPFSFAPPQSNHNPLHSLTFDLSPGAFIVGSFWPYLSETQLIPSNSLLKFGPGLGTWFLRFAKLWNDNLSPSKSNPFSRRRPAQDAAAAFQERLLPHLRGTVFERNADKITPGVETGHLTACSDRIHISLSWACSKSYDFCQREMWTIHDLPWQREIKSALLIYISIVDLYLNWLRYVLPKNGMIWLAEIVSIVSFAPQD